MTGIRKHYNDGFEGPPLEAGITWFDSASAGSPAGQDTVGGLIGEADDIAVGRKADAPNTLSPSIPTTIGERQAIADLRELLRQTANALACSDHNDPLEPIADNGMTVWDGMRAESKRLWPLVTKALATPTTNAPVVDREAIALIVNDGRGPAGAESFGGLMGHSLAARMWAKSLAKADDILALRQTLPIHGEMREALDPSTIAELADIVRTLSNSDCECDSLHGHSCLRCRARNALQGDGL